MEEINFFLNVKDSEKKKSSFPVRDIPFQWRNFHGKEVRVKSVEMLWKRERVAGARESKDTGSSNGRDTRFSTDLCIALNLKMSSNRFIVREFHRHSYICIYIFF
jgi:hypothetical protein